MLRLATLILAVALQGTTLATTTGPPVTDPNGTVRSSTQDESRTTYRTSREWSTPAPSHGPSTVDHRPSTAEQTTGQRLSTSVPYHGPSTAEPTTKQQPLSTEVPLHGPSTVYHRPSTGQQTTYRPSTPAPSFRPSTAYHRVLTSAPADPSSASHRPSSPGGTTGTYRTTEESRRGPVTMVKPIVADPGAWAYSVLDGAGQTCIRMSLRATLSVQYKTVDNETRSVEVPVPETEATGFCHEKEAQLSLAWSNFELRWTFAKIETNGTWQLTSLEADFKKSEAPFENALINDGGTVKLETRCCVQASLGRAFYCPNMAFNNTAEAQNVTLHLPSLLVQAFASGDAISQTDTCPDAESQPSTSTPPLVPTTRYFSSQSPNYQTMIRNLPYEAPTVQSYVYKKVHSNMVKVYPPKKLMTGMYGDQSDPMGAMLWSWYMSGFYTGYYQALQQGKKF